MTQYNPQFQLPENVSSMDAGLVIRNLNVSYRVGDRSVNVLRNIDLDVAPGEVVGIVGESGSGKSTLAYSIVRYLSENAQTSADVMRFNGENLLDLTPRRMREIRGTAVGMVYQDPSTALNPTMRIGKQLLEAINRRGKLADPYGEAIGLLEMVRLANPESIMTRFSHEISGGERQRVLIAMAFAMRPKLLIFDEATTALDATTASGIISLIQKLQSETQVAIIFISHDLGTVSRLAHRIVVLYKGDLVETGPAQAVLGAPSEPYTKKLLSARPNPFAENARIAKPASSPDILLSASDMSIHYGRDRWTDRLLGRSSGRFMAVRGIDISIAKGSTVGLVGESGCGKSTLARALAGLSAFDGTIEFGGRTIGAIEEIDRSYRQSVQIIFQNPDLALNPRLTVGELIGRPMRLYDLVPRRGIGQAVAQLLEAVHLPASYAGRYTNQLSGGEKQRVSIARAFAARPQLVICDEITSSLDVSVQAAILELLAELQREFNTAYLFITHDLQVLQSIADDVAVMYLGRIVERRRSREAILSPPLHPYSEALLSSSPIAVPGIEIRQVRADGPLPSPKSPPQGCAFSSRCARRIGSVCDTVPPLREGPDGHQILCHLPWSDLAAVPPIWTRVKTA